MLVQKHYWRWLLGLLTIAKCRLRMPDEAKTQGPGIVGLHSSPVWAEGFRGGRGNEATASASLLDTADPLGRDGSGCEELSDGWWGPLQGSERMYLTVHRVDCARISSALLSSQMLIKGSAIVWDRLWLPVLERKLAAVGTLGRLAGSRPTYLVFLLGLSRAIERRYLKGC